MIVSVSQGILPPIQFHGMESFEHLSKGLRSPCFEQSIGFDQSVQKTSEYEFALVSGRAHAHVLPFGMNAENEHSENPHQQPLLGLALRSCSAAALY